MQLRDLAEVLAIFHDLEVGLVPGCQGGETRTGELSQGMQKQPVDDQCHDVDGEASSNEAGERGATVRLGVHGEQSGWLWSGPSRSAVGEAGRQSSAADADCRAARKPAAGARVGIGALGALGACGTSRMSPPTTPRSA